MADKSGKEIVVKFEHLNPALQNIIGGKHSIYTQLKQAVTGSGLEEAEMQINAARTARLTFDYGLAANLGVAFATPEARAFFTGAGGVSLLARTRYAMKIQKQHQELIGVMKDNGIIRTGFEGDYPRDWINPTIVGKTHPIFYVDLKGDVHFTPNSRMEYARYKFQQTRFGKAGFNPWMFRGYLSPPTAPEKTREWAASKVREWAQKIQPAFQPGFKQPVPIKVHYRTDEAVRNNIQKRLAGRTKRRLV